MALNFHAVAENSAINGGTVTITLPTSMLSGDYVVVTYACPVAPAGGLAVRSSVVGDSYTNISGTITSTVNACVMGVFAYKQGATVRTQAVCTGTGNSSDGITAVCIVLRDDAQNPALDTTPTTGTGSGTTPDSPSITVITSNDVILSCVAAAISDTTVTAPTSFVNQVDINASDTRSTTAGMAMITLASTAAFNPASWTNFTSAGWCAATVAVRPGSTALNVFTVKSDDLWSGYMAPVKVISY